MVMYNVSSDSSSSNSLYWLEIKQASAQSPYIQGYLKQGTKIYYPRTSSPITTNLQSTTDGYLVTSNGEVKISVNEEDLEV